MKRLIVCTILFIALMLPSICQAVYTRDLGRNTTCEIILPIYGSTYTWVGTDVRRSVVDGKAYIAFIDVETGKYTEIISTVIIIKIVN